MSESTSKKVEPKLLFAHVAETALVSQKGLLSLVNIYDRINVTQFPAKHRLNLAMRLQCPTGEHDIKIEQVGPDDKIYKTIKGKIQDRPQTSVNQLVEDIFEFTQPGMNKFIISFDSQIIGEANIEVVKVDAQQNLNQAKQA